MRPLPNWGGALHTVPKRGNIVSTPHPRPTPTPLSEGPALPYAGGVRSAKRAPGRAPRPASLGCSSREQLAAQPDSIACASGVRLVVVP